MSGFLQDTSVFIGLGQGRSVAEAPNGDGRVSVATLTELDVGVRRSSDGAVRERRALTLAKARRFVPLAYDEAVSGELAVLLAAARDQGHRAGLMDTARGSWTPSSPRPRSCTTVWTQDDDFEVLQELAPQLRVHRS